MNGMEQMSLWDEGFDIVKALIPASKPLAQPVTQIEPTHYHLKLWFYDPGRGTPVMCSEEPDYYTRYNSNDIWSAQGVGGSLTCEGCFICKAKES